MLNAKPVKCILCAGGPEGISPISGAIGNYHCSNCDVRFLDPQLYLSASEEKARYDIHRNDENDARYISYLEPLFSALHSRLPSKSRGLDFGCGPVPALAGLFRRAGHDVSLYDPYYVPENKFLDERFDFIATSEVVEHFYQPFAEFQQLKQRLKPGGWLGVMTQMVTAETDFPAWHYRKDPTHVVFYSIRSFNWIAEKLEFAELFHPSPRVVLFRRA